MEQDEVVRTRSAAIGAIENELAWLKLIERHETIGFGHAEAFDERTVEAVGDGGEVGGRLSGE
ncbi:hypothetical protein [Luteibacter sp. Lutesp34]|uniref:hypothetical protein n=1 Tax=Luteibacter sp. Lutesp34 TaxID=3243030 RepID=UPI0039B3AFEB